MAAADASIISLRGRLADASTALDAAKALLADPAADPHAVRDAIKSVRDPLHGARDDAKAAIKVLRAAARALRNSTSTSSSSEPPVPPKAQPPATTEGTTIPT